jgi:hypothetical protein
MGDNRLYWNQGDGTFIEDTDGILDAPDLAFGVVVRDLDQDGHVDVLFAANYDGHFGSPLDHSILLFDGAGGFESATEQSEIMELIGSRKYGVMGLQAGDINLDGHYEIFFGNGNPNDDGAQENQLFSAHPSLEGLSWTDQTDAITFESPLGTGPFRSHGTAIFDQDQDGRMDFFLGNGGLYVDQAEPNRMFHNITPCRNASVRVRLRGENGNTAGLGARIRVEDENGEITWALVTGDSGFLSSTPALTTVGMGTSEGPYDVTVYWADGTVDQLGGVLEFATVEIEQGQGR